MSVITLTTDFGLSDWFVGTMKGVIASIAPKAKVIDVTHDLAPGNVRAAAFALSASYHFFPKGTIHVVVVDPGVGSPRDALAVQTANYAFVAPDNGVLSLVLKKERIKSIRILQPSKYFLEPVSSTFHGRDVFAPVAAHWSLGTPGRKFGPTTNQFVRLDWPEPIRKQKQLCGEVVHLDRFGNGITNIPEHLVRELGCLKCVVQTSRRQICPIKGFYQAVGKMAPVAVVGSTGFLEIAVNGGSAKKELGLQIGTKVSCQGPE